MDPTDARRILLAGLIDDAALFPPAREPMDVALRGHRDHRAGPLGWMVGRFVCPASRLAELREHWPAGLDELRLSVVCDVAAEAEPEAFGEALAGELDVAGAVARGDPRLRLEAIEVRLPWPGPEALEAVEAAAATLVGGTPPLAFAEAPDSTDPSELEETVRVIAEARATGAGWLHAKLRCGGLAPELIPSPAAVATFLIAAARADVPWKATAGLHHPLRDVDPASGMLMHGFVNLLAAAGLVASGALGEVEVAIPLLADEERAAFALDTDGLRWREHRVGGEAVAAVRRAAFTSYGSCSFDEPTADLAALGWLP